MTHFLSISMSAPMIGSTNDETTFATDQVHPIPEESVDGNSHSTCDLNEKTPTNEEFKFKPIESEEKLRVDFKVGGEIHNATGVKSKISFLSCGPASLDTCSTISSNSTIVKAGSKKSSNNNLMEGSTTSLMDLENVRPPSSMDSISMCSYQDLSIQQSPMRGSLHKKSLMSGKFYLNIAKVKKLKNVFLWPCVISTGLEETCKLSKDHWFKSQKNLENSFSLS